MFKIAKIKQLIKTPEIENPSKEAVASLKNLRGLQTVKKGSKIAITAGSRGIYLIDKILKEIVSTLIAMEFKPFLFPAMGSHGNATADGQVKVLKSLRINEERIGCPIISSMNVIEIGKTAGEVPVYIDAHAAKADGILVINRVKAHTIFSGDIESGIVKMIAVGMGKEAGAAAVHKNAFGSSLQKLLPEMAAVALSRLPIIGAIAIVENAYDKTALITAIEKDEIFEKERKLLIFAKEISPKLPVDFLHFLIVDEIGKNYSGSGMDTNIIGRRMHASMPELESPKILRIFARDISSKSNGNSIGLGLADFTTERLVKKIDHKATYLNCITSGSPEKAKIPMHFSNDKEAIAAAINTIGPVKKGDIKALWIKNTLELEEMFASEAVIKELGKNENIKKISKLRKLSFDRNGNLMHL